MYRTLHICGPKPLQTLCSLFDKKSHLGNWTQAVYVRSLRPTDNVVTLGMEDNLSALTRQCPNLRYFNVACPLMKAYRLVVGSLRFYCSKSLTSVDWTIPVDSQARIISAIATMRNLVSLKLELTGPLYDCGRTRAGYGCLVNVELPFLYELVLRGSIQDFSEEVPSWELPSLRTLVLDFGSVDCDLPDILDVLSEHGPQLTTLDINCRIPFNVPEILELCSSLNTFCFNLDWRFDGVLTKTPHRHIERVGMHGLHYAFGVGVVGALATNLRFIEATVLRNRNDLNFAALNKYNFPNLKVLRVLDPAILRGLNASNGPAKGGPAHCYERWEKWWDTSARMRVKLEDCTGAPLGTLPEDEEGEDDEEMEECEEYTEYDDEYYEYDDNGGQMSTSTSISANSNSRTLQGRVNDTSTHGMTMENPTTSGSTERPSSLVSVS